MHDRLIDGRTADKITGTKRSHRYELMRRGEYPQPVKIGKLTRFSERECVEWIQRRLEARGMK